MTRGTTARMRRGAEATWHGRGWPTRGAGGAQGVDTWQEATRVHAVHVDAREGATWQEATRVHAVHVDAREGATWRDRLAIEGPTG